MQRHRVGQPADVARHHRHRAKLTHRPRIAQDHAVQQAPLDVGQRHAKEGLPTRCTQHDGGLLLFAALCLHERNQLTRHERKSDENGRQHNAWHGKDDLEVVVRQIRSEPSLRTEQQHVDQARNDRRNGERQVDQREQQVLAAKLELGDGPRCRHAKHHVERHGNQRDGQRQDNRGQCIGLDQRFEINIHALLERLVEHARQRHEQEQREEDERHEDQRRTHPGGFGGGTLSCGRASRRCLAELTGNSTGHVRLLPRWWSRFQGHARWCHCDCHGGASRPATG